VQTMRSPMRQQPGIGIRSPSAVVAPDDAGHVSEDTLHSRVRRGWASYGTTSWPGGCPLSDSARTAESCAQAAQSKLRASNGACVAWDRRPATRCAARAIRANVRERRARCGAASQVVDRVAGCRAGWITLPRDSPSCSGATHEVPVSWDRGGGSRICTALRCRPRAAGASPAPACRPQPIARAGGCAQRGGELCAVRGAAAREDGGAPASAKARVAASVSRRAGIRPGPRPAPSPAGRCRRGSVAERDQICDVMAPGPRDPFHSCNRSVPISAERRA
jgi:hypothetical protein